MQTRGVDLVADASLLGSAVVEPLKTLIQGQVTYIGCVSQAVTDTNACA